jgi:branched-chain amino acid transport system substrate-binding protein
LVWATTTGIYADGIGSAFRRRYRERYAQLPGHSNAGVSYDQVNLLARAWGRLGDARDFTAVANELRHIVHRGVNGSYYFDHAGQCGLAYPDVTPDPSLGQAHLCFQVQHGRHRIVAPEPYCETRFAPAPWQTASLSRVAA